MNELNKQDFCVLECGTMLYLKKILAHVQIVLKVIFRKFKDFKVYISFSASLKKL